MVQQKNLFRTILNLDVILKRPTKFAAIIGIMLSIQVMHSHHPKLGFKKSLKMEENLHIMIVSQENHYLLLQEEELLNNSSKKVKHMDGLHLETKKLFGKT